MSGVTPAIDETGEPSRARDGRGYAASRRAQLPTVTLGRYRRFRREAVQARIEEQEQSKNIREN